MKRLLAVFALLLALSVPQFASASSFAFGPEDGSGNSIFDTGTTLLDNLDALNAAVGGTAWFVPGSIEYFSDTTFKFAGLGYSSYAQTFSITVYNGNTPVGSVAEGFNIAAPATVADLYFEYYDVNLGSLERVALADLTMTVYQFYGSMDYVVDGVSYGSVGSIFFGFSIPGSGNDIDFILAGTPYAPSVPVPAAVWLFGTGLAGVYAVRKRSN